MDELLDASSLYHILARLDCSRDICATALASSTLASVAGSQSLWATRLAADLDIHTTLAPPPPAAAAVPAAAAAAAAAQPPGDAPPPAAAEPDPAAAAAAAGDDDDDSSSSQQLDLQAAYRVLARAVHSAPPSAVRFGAAFTDGGCDGGAAGELQYWADNVFLPNHWSPHCRGHHCRRPPAAPRAADRRRAGTAARIFGVALRGAAAVLFSPPSAPAQSLEAAAAALHTWSDLGLERLFVDLYQDLLAQQQGSTWGRLLLSGVPHAHWPAEIGRLHAAADAIAASERHRRYRHVQQLPPAALAAATRAQADTAAAGGGDGAAGGASAAAGDARRQPLSQQQQDQQQQQRRQAKRHMVDASLLPWFADGSACRSTALISEVVVSRVGHFTCPVAAGAVLLGQHPGTPGSASGAASSGDATSADCQPVLAIRADPYVAALNGVTTLEALTQAVDRGLLPPLLQHQQGPGWEWVEFEPLTTAARQARAAQGWHMCPVLWFRLSTPADGHAGATAAAVAAAAAGEGAVVAAADAMQDDAQQQQEQQQEQQVVDAAGDPTAAAAAEAAPADAQMEHEQPDAPAPAPAAAAAAAAAGDDADSVSNGSFYSGLDEDDDELQLMSDAASDDDGGLLLEHEEYEQDMALDDAVLPHGPLQPLMLPLPPLDQPPPGAGAAAGASGDATAQQQDQPGQQQQQRDQPQQQCDHPASPQQQQQQQQAGRPARQPRGRPGVAVLPSPPGLFEVDHSGGATSNSLAAAAGIAVGAGGGPPLPPAQHLLLRMPLARRPRSGNVAVLKLLSCEDHMAEFEDPSETPNIDVQYVALRGVAVEIAAAIGTSSGAARSSSSSPALCLT